MTFTYSWWPEQQNIGTPVNPLGTFCEGHNLRFGHAGHRHEVKAGESFVRTQVGLYAMAVNEENAAGGKVVRETRLLTDLRERIRDVRQGPDGLIYLLTDHPQGRLLRLTP